MGAHTVKDGEARIVVGHMSDKKEVEVGMMLLDAGLELVATHVPVSPNGDRSENKGEVDLLFKHGDTAFIVEVSVQRVRGEKLRKFFEVFSNKENLEELKSCSELADTKNFRRVYFDMRHDYNEKEVGDITGEIGKDGNHIVLKNEFADLQRWVRSEKRKRVDGFHDILSSRRGSDPILFPGGT